MRRADDRGVALIAVIGLGMVMLLLIATGLTVASSGLRQADTGQDTSGATDAAYAGVQDYLARINSNPTYLQYGNKDAAFSATSGFTTFPADNKAFLLGTSLSNWAVVPGSDNLARFRYEVDTSTYASSGVLRLRSTGLVGSTTKSIVASFRVRGFIDYTYFTDYEIQDPQVSGAADSCVLHAWEGRAAACPTIQFGVRDNLNGRVHSNDTMIICGATFTGSVTTANPNTPLYSTSGCTSTSPSVPITRAAQLPMPSTNTSMLTDAKCLYTGPTRITYTDDGYMTVVSPWSLNTVGSSAVCGTIAALRSTAGAKVPQLDGDLLYVQDVENVNTADPNYWTATSKPPGLTCLDANANATTDGNGPGWSLTTGTTTIRYPITGETPASNWRVGTQWSTTNPAYGCRNGDLYVQGVVTKATTAASENYVYVTSNLTTYDRTQDVLGLVGQNAVLVYNPMSALLRPLLTDTDREIDAALLSVAHTFQVQNYNVGTYRGTLTVFGSIAQKFRGPVATLSGSTFATGYAKAYSYNPLLSQVSPPKFLAPSALSFLLQRYASVPPAFNADGSQQP